MRAALKRAIENEKLIRVKGSYKIASKEKKILTKRRSIMTSVVKAQENLKSSLLPSPTNSSLDSSYFSPRKSQRTSLPKVLLDISPTNLSSPKKLRPSCPTSPSSPKIFRVRSGMGPITRHKQRLSILRVLP